MKQQNGTCSVCGRNDATCDTKLSCTKFIWGQRLFTQRNFVKFVYCGMTAWCTARPPKKLLRESEENI